VIKKVHTNMCPILTVMELWAFFSSCTRPRVNRVLQNQLECGEGGMGEYSPGQCTLHDRATRAVHNRAAACVAASGGIFENQL
jgi:hypothetical protein